jgi:uncharacterized membrane protein YeaQ/YmgE (transglycosylase-associated protein family)
MLIAADMVTALIIAGTLAYIFARNLMRRSRRSGFFWFFLIIFMITWAGGAWMMPFDAATQGLHWLPFLIAGMAGAVVVTYLARRRPPTNRHETIDLLESIAEERKLEKATYLSLGFIFWVVLFLLMVAIVVRYVLQ